MMFVSHSRSIYDSIVDFITWLFLPRVIVIIVIFWHDYNDHDDDDEMY